MDIVSELRELTRNLWWTWQPNVIALFRDLDPVLWRRVNHNPMEFLSAISREALESQAFDLASESRINYALHRLQEYLHREQSWGDSHAVPSAPARWPTSPPSSGSTSPCRSTRAASASWPATT